MLKLFDRVVLEATPSATLDQLWHEAERLGKVSVEPKFLSSEIYQCQIRFKRRTGTTINAVGEDQSVHVAVAKAINEAREMGAGQE